MSAVAATFFDGRSSRAHLVQVSTALLDAGGSVLLIRAGDWERNELLSGIRVTPRVSGIHRTLVLRDGGQLQVEDNNAVDAWFPNRDRAAGWIDRLERHSVAVAASLLITVASIIFVIFFGIPYAAEKIAAHIPPSVAREMGEQTVTLLNRFGLENSKLPQKRRDELQAAFSKYVANLPDPKHYQLRFLDAKQPNAFALPGGIIVVTDEMVRLIDTKTVGVEDKSAGKDAVAADDEDDSDGEDGDEKAASDELTRGADEAKGQEAAKVAKRRRRGQRSGKVDQTRSATNASSPSPRTRSATKNTATCCARCCREFRRRADRRVLLRRRELRQQSRRRRADVPARQALLARL